MPRYRYTLWKFAAHLIELKAEVLVATAVLTVVDFEAAWEDLTTKRYSLLNCFLMNYWMLVCGFAGRFAVHCSAKLSIYERGQSDCLHNVYTRDIIEFELMKQNETMWREIFGEIWGEDMCGWMQLRCRFIVLNKRKAREKCLSIKEDARCA